MNSRLTLETFNKALTILAQRDPDLGAVIAKFGKPPIWRRPRGFETLVLLILEQQVSLASARAAYDRLAATAVELAPEKMLTLRDEEYRAAGVSRQKTRYIRHLSDCILDRSLRLDGLGRMSDDDVRAHLMQIKGIGAWTADVYLLMALMRPDVWPVGDIALQAAAHGIKGLDARPNPEQLTEIGEEWRPWRSVAARILWHHYLSTPRFRTTGRLRITG
jgi:DNA-3-methyladenine glycosylase II